MIDPTLIAEAELGEEARKFWESDVGRALKGMAEQEARSAEIALGKINPKDEAGIVALQRRIQCAEWFHEWITELISRGDDAITTFIQQKGAE